jgi:hypothetical protein
MFASGKKRLIEVCVRNPHARVAAMRGRLRHQIAACAVVPRPPLRVIHSNARKSAVQLIARRLLVGWSGPARLMLRRVARSSHVFFVLCCALLYCCIAAMCTALFFEWIREAFR